MGTLRSVFRLVLVSLADHAWAACMSVLYPKGLLLPPSSDVQATSHPPRFLWREAWQCGRRFYLTAS